MQRHIPFTTTAILLSIAAMPAQAGEADRARTAIAEARGKITAGDKVGTSNGAPLLQTEARAALTDAETLLSHGKKSEAIVAAHRAGQLADQAIVNADQLKMTAARERRMDAEATAANAQAGAAAETARANAAERAADTANARADALARPAPVATTVQIVEKTVTPAPVKRTTTHKRTVVHHKAPVTTASTTTTTVTSKPN
ncbi:MAG: hypothetical protein CFE37_11305 [Alphaproteobacteria bacterium PA4]|nr:MAG: hypothetical protein CFE37_11305 [Alphaproteobacteria bacterium PA4]